MTGLGMALTGVGWRHILHDIHLDVRPGEFLGLLGPQGALPLHLTNYAHYRQQHTNDTTLVRFLDVFHHRVLTRTV